MPDSLGLRIREVIQCFRETGLGQKVVQAGGEAGALLLVLRREVFGDFLQGCEVRGGITVPKRVIGDEVEAALEEIAEEGDIGGHGLRSVQNGRLVKEPRLDLCVTSPLSGRVIDLPPDCECVLLFDGLCHLCDGGVRFVVAHDQAERIHFAPIQGDLGRRLYAEQGLDADAPNTMLLVTREQVFRASDVVIEIARRLGGAWKLAVLGKVIPRGLRDAAYYFVARNRYRWFGKHETCLMPTPELRRRMLA